jgi:prepilin-type N-terminal cleavage/methylation domain-containing protein
MMRRGFTLLEIIIVLAIALVCFLVILGMYISQSQLFTNESNIAELQTINSIAQETLSGTIEQGMEIIESRTINGTAYASDSDTIIIKLPAYNASKTIINGIYDYIAFNFDTVNSKIISNTETGTGSARISGEKTVANFVSALNFRYNSNVWTSVNEVEMTLATKKEIGGAEREEQTFKTIQLKNK